MARVTIQDAVEIVGNRFDLIMVATKRARQLATGGKEAKVDWDKIEFVAYSAGPGLDPALWAGYHIAKKWATDNSKKLVGVNHCAAHLSIGKFVNKLKNPFRLGSNNIATIPINPAPAIVAPVPAHVTPPDVPRTTAFPLLINLGFSAPKTPSSVAPVSPFTVANAPANARNGQIVSGKKICTTTINAPTPPFAKT